MFAGIAVRPRHEFQGGNIYLRSLPGGWKSRLSASASSVTAFSISTSGIAASGGTNHSGGTIQKLIKIGSEWSSCWGNGAQSLRQAPAMDCQSANPMVPSDVADPLMHVDNKFLLPIR
jgi:hypothetical protein